MFESASIIIKTVAKDFEGRAHGNDGHFNNLKF